MAPFHRRDVEESTGEVLHADEVGVQEQRGSRRHLGVVEDRGVLEAKLRERHVADAQILETDIAGEASILMNIQEMSTAIQYRLPVKIFILNNEYMGMVRQWQELLHDKNYSESYTEALPDFVKLAEAYGAVGIRAKTPDELDEKIKEMINTDKPVIFDCVVDKVENCYPMIPSGKPHNQMLLGPEDEKEEVSDEGKTLV